MFLAILKCCIAICLASLLWAAPAHADVFKLGHMRLSGDIESGLYVLTITVPSKSISPSGIILPEGCRIEETRRAYSVQKTRYYYSFFCSGTLDGVIRTPWRLDGARFINELSPDEVGVQNLLPGPLGIDIPLGLTRLVPRQLTVLARTYVEDGIMHIWFGWDHLLFVLCLCFLLRGRQLIGMVTAFTVGHSLTLALSYFNMVTISIAPVESLIALSILLMARQALRAKPRQNVGSNLRTMLIIAAFGLLHGLGFASALSELGASDAEKWPALIFFNLGIEAGQIVFVGIIAMVIRVLQSGKFYDPVRTALLGSTGCLAGFWFIERLATLNAV